MLNNSVSLSLNLSDISKSKLSEPMLCWSLSQIPDFGKSRLKLYGVINKSKTRYLCQSLVFIFVYGS